MPELTALQGRTETINIVRRIGVQWTMVGTTLLDDKDGTIIPAIADQHGNNADRINMDILGRWIRGEGILDHSWRGLLGVLRVHCGEALAQSVEEVLIEQGKSYSHSYLTAFFFLGLQLAGSTSTNYHNLNRHNTRLLSCKDGKKEVGGGGRKTVVTDFLPEECPHSK